MALIQGTRLGPYEILAAAGAGGMGEVYKARDSRLNRTVAIKVLPSTIVDTADLRTRFEREAKAISSLNHAHICTLYDVGHQDGVDFLVMEYLEGETLQERLKKGPLPTEELFAYAIQIADALDKAHKQGLVHRDLKPGNIMLTKAGAKLLDFGLAKLQMPNGPVSPVSGMTMTTPLTGSGMILGTLQYMSPEQLEGKDVDGRSDIFSFGAILYEMATSLKPFSGGSQASLIASIIKEQPRPISQIVPLAPPMFDRVVRQCLEKDADHRWQTAGDLKRALQWASEGGSQAGIPLQISTRRKLRERLLWGAVVALGAAALTLGAVQMTRVVPTPKVVRFSILPAKSLNSVTWPKISPDGSSIAFLATDTGGQFGIYLRPLNSLEPHFLVRVAGENSRPFWSPDSKQLAYFDGAQLKKISISGGMAQIICESFGSDGSWGSSGVILYDGSRNDSVRQVPAAGGVPTAASTIDHAKNEHMAAWPCFLPDGEHFLFLADIDTSAEEYSLKVGSIKSLEAKVLGKVNSRVEYANGYVLYIKGGLLVARPFSDSKLEFTGEPVPVSERVSNSGERVLSSVSNDGTLVYQVGQSGGTRSLVQVSRRGDSSRVLASGSRFADFMLSPDNSRIAYGALSEQQSSSDIWVRDLKRNVASRLTFGPQQNGWPIWSVDGLQVYFTSNRKGGRYSIWRRNANGTGSDELVWAVDSADVSFEDISRDGTKALVQVAKSNPDLWLYSFADGKKEPFLTQPYQEIRGTFSPNNRFVAYQTDESNQPQIYIRELGPAGGKWQVSTQPGRCPVWRADGKELFYVTPDYDFMGVPISYENGLEIGTPVKLFNHRFVFDGLTTHLPYTVSNDGQTFYILAPTEEGNAAEFVVIQNWIEELKAH